MLLYSLLLLGSCGFERKDVKTLMDHEASKINYTPEQTTIEALNRITAPRGHLSKRAPSELKVWKISGTLRLVRLEADQDLHVVISDGSYSIIVEIPSPNCTKSLLLTNLRSTREAALRAHKGATVEVTGSAFFDFAHHQTGHALNYIELHPLLTFVEKP